VPARLSAEIDRLIAPFGAEVDLLVTISGVHRRMAQCLVAELGTDVGRFGSPASSPAGPGCARGTTSRGAGQKSGRRPQGIEVAGR
jgi:transposase